MTPDTDESAKRSDQTMNCKYCHEPIEPGQPRTPLQAGGVLHESCGLRTKGETADWLFYCHECGFATDRIGVIQACPSCGSARTSIEPPASGAGWPYDKESLKICKDCFEPIRTRFEWENHECNES